MSQKIYHSQIVTSVDNLGAQNEHFVDVGEEKKSPVEGLVSSPTRFTETDLIYAKPSSGTFKLEQINQLSVSHDSK